MADNFDIIDVYSMDTQVREKQFQHMVTLERWSSKWGHSAMATFDGGALIGGLCSRVFGRMAEGLRVKQVSRRVLRMADGSLVPSQGTWLGRLRIGKVVVHVKLEIFDSKGSWEVLLGKPILRQLRAVHDYGRDVVVVEPTGVEGGSSVELRPETANAEASVPVGGSVHTSPEGEPHAPARQVISPSPENINDSLGFSGNDYLDTTAVMTLTDEQRRLCTRTMDPFQKARVDAIVREVRVGSDLTMEERGQVEDLVREYADCFALSLSEVNAVPGAVHKLSIPEGSTFSTKVGQRKLTPAQRQFRDAKLDEMIAAGVVRSIHPSEVRCAAPTVMAPKPYENGLPLAELQHMVNDQCVAHGIEGMEGLPPRPELLREEEQKARPPQWRICHNFTEINKVTEIAPMPQGDIRQKQQNLSGHRYLHVFDFAAGFHAITVHPDSQPYITFYVEGRGYFY